MSIAGSILQRATRAAALRKFCDARNIQADEVGKALGVKIPAARDLLAGRVALSEVQWAMFEATRMRMNIAPANDQTFAEVLRDERNLALKETENSSRK